MNGQIDGYEYEHVQDGDSPNPPGFGKTTVAEMLAAAPRPGPRPRLYRASVEEAVAQIRYQVERSAAMAISFEATLLTPEGHELDATIKIQISAKEHIEK